MNKQQQTQALTRAQKPLDFKRVDFSAFKNTTPQNYQFKRPANAQQAALMGKLGQNNASNPSSMPKGTIFGI